MTEIPYCTREDVMSSFDVQETAYRNAQLDRIIAGVTQAIEGATNRVFYPTVATRYFDWPNFQYARPWRLWLDQHEIISLTSLTSGGITITPDQYILRPENTGPPFLSIELRLDSLAAWSAGNTWQQSIAATGLFGYRADEVPAGAAVAGVNSSATTFTVTNSAAVGVGSLLRWDAERMLVTGKSAVSTGQTVTCTASSADNLISVADVTAFVPREIITVDAERMTILDITDKLVVMRASQGSVLAAHTAATAFAPRTLTVTRAVLGTTAASHLAGGLAAHAYPSALRSYAVGEAANTFAQETGLYVRTIGSGDDVRNASGAGLKDLRDRMYQAIGRQSRPRAV